MSNRHAREALRVLVQTAFALFDDLRAPAQGCIDPLVGVLRVPFHATSFTKVLNLEAVLTTDCHLRGPKPPHSASGHAEIDLDVIFELARGVGCCNCHQVNRSSRFFRPPAPPTSRRKPGVIQPAALLRQSLLFTALLWRGAREVPFIATSLKMNLRDTTDQSQ